MKTLYQNCDDKRNSSIELLRIISMLMIVFHHFALHGGFNYDSTIVTIPKLWWNFILIGGKVGVNIFILISGYFLISNTKIELNYKKILKLWGQVIFYSLVGLLFYFIFNNSVDSKMIIKSLLPITFSLWGFASTYFILYLIHPFINRLLHNLSKGEFKFLLGLQFFCWCIIPTLTGQLFQSNTLVWFVFLYSVAAYIKINYININQKANFYFSSCLILYFLTYLSSIIFSILGLRWGFFANHSRYFFGPEKISIFLISMTLFMAFVSMKLPYSKYINKIASTTFGIYLLHDNPIIRDFLWNQLFQNNLLQNNNFIILYSIIVCCLVFIVGCAIDLLRQIFVKIVFKSKIVMSFVENIKLYTKQMKR